MTLPVGHHGCGSSHRLRDCPTVAAPSSEREIDEPRSRTLHPGMSGRSALGDAHNFGRRVVRRGGVLHKPRTLFWEWSLLSAQSPLRKVLGERAFLPDLTFSDPRSPLGGEVAHIELAPIGALDDTRRRELAEVLGRAIALFSWLGIADLHWENLALGIDAGGHFVLAPLDVEVIFADMSLPTETKLLPDPDPEYGALLRHASGARRVLPHLGKPITAADLVAMAGAYHAELSELERAGDTIAQSIDGPELRASPIRVLLRATGDYVAAARGDRVWPPLLDAEREQMARGDIPFFFRLYGKAGIHYYADESLETTRSLGRDGPKLEPLLSLSRGLRSARRPSLRDQGLFALIAAFDHRSFTGTHASEGVEVTFRPRTLVVDIGGETLDTRRDLSAFVGSVYLPCTCGEVESVLAPPSTVCDGARRPQRGSSRRGRKL
jgi:hypothetical protein